MNTNVTPINTINMKKFQLLLLSLAAMLSVSLAQAQRNALAFEPAFYQEAVDGTAFLPAPPSMTSGAWYNDFYYYQWGKEQRQNDSIRTRAIADYHGTSVEYLEGIFSPAFGIEISAENTPELHLLLQRCQSDAHMANSAAKGQFERLRPFVQMGEESIEPEFDEEERQAFSYPSGHTTRCYVPALVLCMINPAATEALMLEAYHYSMNRVICGHHWKSDVDASTVLAMAVAARLPGNEEFLAQFHKALEEYRQHTTGVKTTPAPIVMHPATKELINNTVVIHGENQDYSTSGTVINW